MTDLNKLTDAADDAELDLPFHYGPDTSMPCFACFVESMLSALDDCDTLAEKQHAMDIALTQIADCIGALFLQLALDSEGAVSVFSERIHALVAANNGAEPAPAAAPDKHQH
jgi:hypothetical protein